MRKFFIILAFLIGFSPIVKAELYAVKRDDGGVSIVNYVDGSQDSLEDVLKSLGLENQPIRKIQPADIPSKQDRKYWRLNDVPAGPKIIIDQAAKQADQAAKAQKQTEIQQILGKICPTCTLDEFKKLVRES